MLILSERLLDVPILSLQTGVPVARTSGFIIDPRRMHVMAFYCEGSQLVDDESVLHTADIREFSNIGIIVNNSDDIMSPSDLVRLQEVLEYNFNLIGMSVIDSTRQRLGKVCDFSTETDSFLIKTFTVKRPLFKALNDTELVINRTQIIEVTRDHIIVKAPTVEEKKSSKQTVISAFDNPFRTKPQPESPSQSKLFS